MAGLKKIVAAYDKLEEILLVISIVVSVGLLFINVVLRYLFNGSIFGVDEITRILFIWMSWLGVSIGEKRNEHIKIDILSNKLQGLPLKVVTILADVITIAILGTLTYLGILLSLKYIASGATSPMWHVNSPSKNGQ